MADETETQDQDKQEEQEQDEPTSEDEDSESKKAQEKEEEREHAREKIEELEEGDPPSDLEDWPDDAAKYETFGGPEGEHGYHEGPEQEKLGPASLRHHEDGRVTIAGDEVDDPDDYKSEPIPGGPTDPDAKQDLTAKKIREDQGRDMASDDDEDTDSDSDSDSESESESESDSGS